MITGYIKGQNLELRSPLVVADTIDYLTAQFVFQTVDWEGCRLFSHWKCGETNYTIELSDAGKIEKEQHLNLTAGTWTVWIHGERYRDGELIQRITTDEATLAVIATGTAGGSPFPEVPASDLERINAEIAELQDKVGSGGGAASGDAMRLLARVEVPYEGTPPIIDMIDFSRKYTFLDIAEAYVAGRTITLNTEYDLVPYQYGMFWLDHLSSHVIEFHGHYRRVKDVEADVEEGWVPAVAFLREDGTLTIEDREWSGYAKQAEVDSLSKAIADNKSNIEKLLDANSEVIIKGDEYDWAAGYFDANGHFNGAYYYRIAIKQWFEVEPGETYRFQSNSTDKLLIRGYRGTTGYDFVETLVTLEADKTITIPESINHITITLSREEDGGDSVAMVNQMLVDAAAGLINPTVTRLFVSGGSFVEVDTTLSQSGKAADAKAVGDKFAEQSEAIDDKLDADKLPEAVNDALAQAKASGEFDGEDGSDYVLTETDKTEIAEIVAGMVDVPEGGGSGGAGTSGNVTKIYTVEEDVDSYLAKFPAGDCKKILVMIAFRNKPASAPTLKIIADGHSPAAAITFGNAEMVWCEINHFKGDDNITKGYYTITFGASNNFSGRTNTSGTLQYPATYEDGFLLTNLTTDTIINIFGAK